MSFNYVYNEGFNGFELYYKESISPHPIYSGQSLPNQIIPEKDLFGQISGLFLSGKHTSVN